MATSQDYSRVSLNDFPGYDAYCITHLDGTYGLRSINNDPILFRYYCRYHRYPWLNDHHGLIKEANCPSIICGTSTVSESDCLIIHPNCTVPRSLISVGKVLNEKSPETQTKLVVPCDYTTTLSGVWVVPIVNHDAKIVFLVVTDIDEGDMRGTEIDWLNALPKSPELANSFPQDVLCSFTMPYGKSVFMFGNFNEIDIALLNGLIHSDMVVCENRLTTGTKPLTVDVLYSCYKMLNSSDNQIVESACNMLARNRFSDVDALVGWILRTYKRKIGYYRNKSTAFRWLWSMCLNQYMIPSHMKQTGKELVLKITNNEIYWDSNTMVVTKASWFDDSSIRALVDLINK